MTLWTRRDRLDEINSLKAYLIVSLRHQVLERLRKEQVQSSLDGISEKAYEIQFSAEEIIIVDESKKHRKRALTRALNQLPSKQRETIYLRYFNGMGYKEIGEILSINNQSVRNHIYPATKKLKSLLEETLNPKSYCILS